MRLEQNITLRQSQQLSLTPQMQQAIHILQLSTLELQELINTELLENPFLDADTQETIAVDVPDESPLNDLDDDIYSNYWPDSKTCTGYVENDTMNWLEETIATPCSLHDHLRQQLRIITACPDTLKIGNYLIDLVDEDGFIKADLTEAAADLQCCHETVLSVLALLQKFDPIGVCARSLEECFRLQLQEAGSLNQSLSTVLSNMTVILDKGLHGLSKHCQIPREELKEALAELRQLNPKPGQGFMVPTTQTLIPDLLFKYTKGQWQCELNEASLPKIFINSDSYADLVKRAHHPQDKHYINEKFRSAKWLEKTIANRLDTMLKVGRFILQHQVEFFEHGQSKLKSMTLKDLASVLNMHESTVARAVNNKYATTPHGIIELKSLFSTLVAQDSGDMSNKAIQFNISTLITAENRDKPLSDDQLVKRLQDQGITIARRTVTKYREAMNIPSSYDRKKHAQLMTF